MDTGLLLIATLRTGDLASLARRAEEVGFESLWIPEHPVIPVERTTPFPFAGGLPEHYGRWLDPFVALTVAHARRAACDWSRASASYPSARR